jgi:hypothetical protein
MSRFNLPVVVPAITILVLFILNVVNIPRGPVLNCYHDAGTYQNRQSSYGFPFIVWQGNTTGDTCVKPVATIYPGTYDYLDYKYNYYQFHQIRILFNIGVAAALAAGMFLVISKLNKLSTVQTKLHSGKKTGAKQR